MPIVFEEVSGEVAPERDRDEGEEREQAAAPEGMALDERVRAVLAREAFRARRLSDR